MCTKFTNGAWVLATHPPTPREGASKPFNSPWLLNCNTISGAYTWSNNDKSGKSIIPWNCLGQLLQNKDIVMVERSETLYLSQESQALLANGYLFCHMLDDWNFLRANTDEN